MVRIERLLPKSMLILLSSRPFRFDKFRFLSFPFPSCSNKLGMYLLLAEFKQPQNFWSEEIGSAARGIILSNSLSDIISSFISLHSVEDPSRKKINNANFCTISKAP